MVKLEIVVYDKTVGPVLRIFLDVFMQILSLAGINVHSGAVVSETEDGKKT